MMGPDDRLIDKEFGFVIAILTLHSVFYICRTSSGKWLLILPQSFSLDAVLLKSGD